MLQGIEAGREHQLGPSVDTRTRVSLQRLGFFFDGKVFSRAAGRLGA